MAFISEIHYQNTYAANSGVSEYVEFVLTADEYANAADYTVATYQADGTLADVTTLDQLTATYDADLDVYTFHWETPVTSPDHSPGGDAGAGEAEAVAFVNTATDEIISFIDIGGGTNSIVANGGAVFVANQNASTSISSETIPNASSGESIQFDPFGNRIDGPLTPSALPYQSYTISGEQIGSFGSASSTGNGDDLVLSLTDVAALGTASESYTIIVTQVSNGDDYFNNGQFITLIDGNGNTVFENIGVQNDAFQGRAAGDPYLVLSNGYVIDVRGLPALPTDADYTIDDDVIGAPYAEPYGELNFDDLVGAVPCFTAGTLIDTINGVKPVEDLKCGDLVRTKDKGYQPIVWVGRKRIRFSSRNDRPHLRPIRIPRGEVCSQSPLTVSPQHRVLGYGENVNYFTGLDEVLVSAEHLRKCGAARRIYKDDSVTYYHFMTAHHELVLANGNWAESLDPFFLFNAQSTKASKREVLSIFGADVPLGAAPAPCVRPVLKSYEARVLFKDIKKTPSKPRCEMPPMDLAIAV